MTHFIQRGTERPAGNHDKHCRWQERESVWVCSPWCEVEVEAETCGRCPVRFEPGEDTFVIQSPGGARFHVCRECAESFDRWLGKPEKPQLDRTNQKGKRSMKQRKLDVRDRRGDPKYARLPNTPAEELGHDIAEATVLGVFLTVLLPATAIGNVLIMADDVRAFPDLVLRLLGYGQ